MSGGKGASRRRRWFILGALVLLALAIVLPPLINIGRYQRRIAALISRSIGRSVHMSSVSLRLLPVPAVEMPNFVVEEKPGFGAEPILRADNVVAYPRLSSLWRGRLEIARLQFDDASLNLVRAPDGTWNFASILVQAAHSSSAPTGQRHPGLAPRFPYIEAENARINFKEGIEKKPFSFLNADLSVWLDSSQQWGIHFRAQPVRTDLDLDLSDSGTLRIDGTLRRAAVLAQMPLELNARWTAAPLGELSRLMLGRDIGWRGNVDFQARVTGPVENAHVRATLKIAALHRDEFTPAQPLDLKTVCDASYRRLSASVENIACISQAGGGMLSLTGAVRQMRTTPQMALALKIQGVPAATVLDGLREMREGFASGLQAEGDLNGELQYAQAPGAQPLLNGTMGFSSLTLTPPGSSHPVVLTPVRFSFESPVSVPQRKRLASRARAEAPRQPFALLLDPVRLSLGAPAPLTVEGRLTLHGFSLHLSGEAALSRLSGLNRILHQARSPDNARLSTSALAPTGDATLDVSVLGPWILPISDSDQPTRHTAVVGSITVKNAKLTATYLRRPLRIVSAEAMLSPSAVAWTNASVAYGPLEAQGTLEYPTACDSGDFCAGRFYLKAGDWNLADLQSALVGPTTRDDLLREFLSRIDHHRATWPRLTGTVQVGALAAGKLLVHDVQARVEIAGGSMRIQSFNGHLPKGTLHLGGTLDASGGTPAYDLDVQVADASPSQIAALFGEHWGTGKLGFSAQLKMAGLTAQDLARSATGTLHWDWKNGSLALAKPPEPKQALAPFSDWHGDGAIGNSAIKTSQSLMVRGSHTLPVSGTLSFDRGLDLQYGASSEAMTIAGDLERRPTKTPPAEIPARTAESGTPPVHN